MVHPQWIKSECWSCTIFTPPRCFTSLLRAASAAAAAAVYSCSVSPPLGEPIAPQTPKGLWPLLTARALGLPQLIVSDTKRTEPSSMPTLTPPG